MRSPTLDPLPAEWEANPPAERCPCCNALGEFIARAFPSGVLTYRCPTSGDRFRLYPDTEESEG